MNKSVLKQAQWVKGQYKKSHDTQTATVIDVKVDKVTVDWIFSLVVIFHILLG